MPWSEAKKGIFTPHAKAPAQGEHSELFGKENPAVGVIDGLCGVRDSQLLAIVLAESVIIRTQDLGKVSSLMDEGSIKKRKDGKLAKREWTGDMTQLVLEFSISSPEGWAKIHGTRL